MSEAAEVIVHRCSTCRWTGTEDTHDCAPGRLVVLDDLRASHPGKPARCLCRGAGVVTTWRNGQQGVQLCAAMVEGFRAKCGERTYQSPNGPRWLQGQAPEDMAHG